MRSLRERFFAGVASFVLGRPWLTLGLCFAVTVGSGLLIPGLRVSTSHSTLVSERDPQQRRMVAFFERFGRPDAPLFVISGGTVEERRTVVDQLEAALEEDAAFHGRVLGHIGLADLAETLLLQDPSALAKIRAALPPDVDLVSLLEGGLPTWLEGLRDRLEAGVDGVAAANGSGQAEEGFEQLAEIGSLLNDAISGTDVGDRLMASFAQREALSGNPGQRSRPAGIDDWGYLVTADGCCHLISIFASLPSDEGVDLLPIVTTLRRIRDDVMVNAPKSVAADLTGLPSLSVDELASIRRGMILSGIVSALGIILCCGWLFRSFWQTVVALVPLIPGIVLTLATVKLLYGHLNLVTSNFFSVLLGLGIDFAVHFISRRNEEVRRGETERRALTITLLRTGPGVMVGALVTTVAFLTSATTSFTAYQELGVIAAIGLIVIMMATFFMLPPLLLLAGRSDQPAQATVEVLGFRAVPGIVRRGRTVFVVVGVAAALGGAIALPRIEFNSRYFSFLPEGTESASALAKLEYDPVASPVFAALTADSFDEARDMAERLRTMKTVAGVQTATDLVPRLDAAALASLRAGIQGLGRDPDFAALAARKTEPTELVPAARAIADLLDEIRFAMEGVGMASESAAHAQAVFATLAKRLSQATADDAKRLAGLHAEVAGLLAPAWRTAKAVAERGSYRPSDLPPLFATRFASKDGQELALYAVPSGNFWKPDVAERFSNEVRTVDADAVGLAMIHVAHGQMILIGFRRAAALAAVLVFLSLIIDFRRLDDAVLALLPTALGWSWMAGILALAGIPFNLANIVSLPLLIGIGIAFGVHLMHRARESERTAGEDRAAVLNDAVRGTGGAIAISALTTIVGFGALMVGEYGALISFGLVMVLGVSSCLLATVFVLPSILVLIGRAR